jgi:hypothetical protein
MSARRSSVISSIGLLVKQSPMASRRKLLKFALAAPALHAFESLAQVMPPRESFTPRVQERIAKQASAIDPFRTVPRSSFGWAVAGRKLYILGGHLGEYHTYEREHFSNELLEYDLDAKSWRRLPDFPHGIQGQRLAAVGGHLYSFGGFIYDAAFDYSPQWNNDVHWSARSEDHVYRYDISRGRWSRVTHMPHRRSSNAMLVAGNRVYLVAGWDGTPKIRGDRNGVFHAMVDVFDVAREEFVPYDIALQPSRRALGGCEMNGKLALLGGLGPAVGGPPPLLDTATVFDPVANSFSDAAIPKLKETLFSAGACFTGRFLVVAGGQPGLAAPLSDKIYVWEPGTKDWRLAAAKLPAAAMFVELLALSPTQVLAFGGHGEPYPLGLWEVLDVSA